MPRLHKIWQRFKQELELWRAVGSHPRTPRAARWLLGLALAYAITPFDIIPDFIPIIGHLDDVIIIPLLAAAAMRLVPTDVINECRAANRAARSNSQTMPPPPL